MSMNERQIDKIVERVVQRLERDLGGSKTAAAPAARPTTGSQFQGHTGHGAVSYTHLTLPTITE